MTTPSMVRMLLYWIGSKCLKSWETFRDCWQRQTTRQTPGRHSGLGGAGRGGRRRPWASRDSLWSWSLLAMMSASLGTWEHPGAGVIYDLGLDGWGEATPSLGPTQPAMAHSHPCCGCREGTQGTALPHWPGSAGGTDVCAQRTGLMSPQSLLQCITTVLCIWCLKYLQSGV